MSKITKEFWVSDCELGCLKDGHRLDITLLKDQDRIYKNKITITYEIDREVTIKESEFEKHLQEWDLNTPSIRVTDYLKEKLFGGGENE